MLAIGNLMNQNQGAGGGRAQKQANGISLDSLVKMIQTKGKGAASACLSMASVLLHCWFCLCLLWLWATASIKFAVHHIVLYWCLFKCPSFAELIATFAVTAFHV